VTVYRHRQVGRKLLIATAVGLILAAWLTTSLSPATRAAVPGLEYGLFAVIAAVALLFGTLVVEVDDAAIRIVFGVGVVRKTIALEDVVRCQIVPIKVLWGMGVHWTPSGWLYNVGGGSGVRVEMARERAAIIGSDDAQALAAAIVERIARKPTSSNET
jgi:hypothetical protein